MADSLTTDQAKAEVIMSTSGMHTMTECPVCNTEISESVEELKAKFDGGLRDKALWISAFVAVFVISLQAYFAWHGKVLPIPDFVWALIVAPWVGESTGRVIALADHIINRGERK